MRPSHPKNKQYPMHPLIDKKQKRTKLSISEVQQLETFNLLEKITIQNGFNSKNKTRTYRKTKEDHSGSHINIESSHTHIGRQANKKLVREESEAVKNRQANMIHSRSTKRPITSKKLITQFEKEMYWNGNNTYMITGIKYQYQKIKQALQKKNVQYDILLKTTNATQHKELLKYIEALEVQNHILARNIQVLQVKGVKNQENNPNFISSLRENIVQKQQKIKKLKDFKKQSKISMKQLRLKVTFLEKLIIEKDNNEHSMAKVCKKVQKDREDYVEKISTLENQLKKLNQEHEEEIFKLKTQFFQLINSKKSSELETKKQYAAIISKLQKQNKYLQSLVDCWKDQMHNETSKNTKKSSKLLKIQKEKEKEKEKDHHQHLVNQFFVSTFENLMGQNNVENDQTDQLQKRTKPYTCQIKNSQNFIKNRRIQIHELQNIIQISRYLLINKQISLDQFISHLQPQNNDPWKEQYINMKQIRQTIINATEISQSQAQMIARYLVQHASTQFVYTDDLNQHHRSVVKSIIRNIYKEYQIYKDKKVEFEKTIEDYRSKLQFSLENITKSGVINKDKFIDLLKSLSIDYKTGLDIYCIAKMIKKSQSLEKLQYKHLFQNKPLPKSIENNDQIIKNDLNISNE